MQNYCKTIGALAAASALVAGTASAEIEYEITAGYTNQYLFRGIELGENLTDVGIEASTEWNGLGISAGAWHASFDAPSVIGNYSNTELDIYAEVTKDLGFAELAVGYIKYINDDTSNNIFGQQLDDAQEVYFGLSKDLGFADASLTYYWDIEHGPQGNNNGYAELGLERSFGLTECVSLGLGTYIGYATEEGEFANWVTTASLDWGFTENATLSPFVTLAIGGPADSGYESDSQNELVGGAKLSVSF